MRFLPLAALLLIAAAPTKEGKKSAPKSEKPTPLARAMKEALKRGSDWTLDESRANVLGMSPDTPGKKIILDGSTDPTQHAVIATLPAAGGAGHELLISSTSAVAFTDGEPSAIDGYTFRTNESGKFISGLRAHGKVDEIEHVKLDPASPKDKKRFDSVMAAIRNHKSLRSVKE